MAITWSDIEPHASKKDGIELKLRDAEKRLGKLRMTASPTASVELEVSQLKTEWQQAEQCFAEMYQKYISQSISEEPG